MEENQPTNGQENPISLPTLNRLLLANAYSEELRKAPRKQYVHVFDGGPSDNLGIESLKTATYQYIYEAERYYGAKREELPCLFISIDAHVDPQLATKIERFQTDTRRHFSFGFDPNAIAATDMLLTLRRVDVLREVKIYSG